MPTNTASSIWNWIQKCACFTAPFCWLYFFLHFLFLLFLFFFLNLPLFSIFIFGIRIIELNEVSIVFGLDFVYLIFCESLLFQIFLVIWKRCHMIPSVKYYCNLIIFFILYLAILWLWIFSEFRFFKIDISLRIDQPCMMLIANI